MVSSNSSSLSFSLSFHSCFVAGLPFILSSLIFLIAITLSRLNKPQDATLQHRSIRFFCRQPCLCAPNVSKAISRKQITSFGCRENCWLSSLSCKDARGESALLSTLSQSKRQLTSFIRRFVHSRNSTYVTSKTFQKL